MIAIKKEGIILRKKALDFENEGVLNPAVIAEDGAIHLFYRAVADGNYSSIGYCRLSDPFTIEKRLEMPVLSPEFDYESHGVEDPRIVKIDDLFYLTYTAYDGYNALAALAVSKDLIHFEKKGLIVPQITYPEFRRLVNNRSSVIDRYMPFNQDKHYDGKHHKELFIWDKNVIFFPRKINGKFYILHRIKPEIQIISVYDLRELTPEFWRDFFKHFENNILLSPKYKHEKKYIGGGCPPIETEHGWLLIYHGVHDGINGPAYTACAALLDLNNPQIELSRLPYPLFEPDLDWELKGEVNNVCFPTGTVVYDDTLYIYYGAADEQIGSVTLSLSELLHELILNTVQYEK
ncbi:glycosidase [Flavobacterium enshiense DK69]|uniref:Pesticidal protein Cry7Aa n=1 Tax=Flavobacterium enshiense DK69 TaxID=1107311 RepID=V6SEB4_9FLAO|nr:glycosidase [Flavobacterium enshiense]ESU22735.1 glycosidase [Flavobacterium enshiense DK69]KGO95570.1 pesticidal protein Cry7Aa [Flavobacterium enshiense DK69]